MLKNRNIQKDVSKLSTEYDEKNERKNGIKC